MGELHWRKGGERVLEIIELFAGLGSQTQALKNIEVPHKVVVISEIDKYADLAYKSLHGEGTPNLGDITKIEELPKADLWTYSFPCTDISLAGKQQGLEKGGGTRSGLLWEVERLLTIAKENNQLPKYLLLENVKNLVGKKFKADYDKWLAFLCSIGYTNYWQVLNAKHYGIPQNRERVFCVSILGEHSPYIFPEKKELALRLKDMLDSEVPEKYYITAARVIAMLTSSYTQRRTNLLRKDVSTTLCARDWREPKCVVLGEIDEGVYAKMTDQHKRLYDENGLAPTLHTCGGGNTQPKVVIGAMRGRNPNNPSDRTKGAETVQRLERGGEVSNTLTTVQKDNLIICEERTDEGVRFFNDNVCGALRSKDSCGDKRVIEVISNTKKGYTEACDGDSINMNFPTSKTRRGRVGKQVAQTIFSSCDQAVVIDEENAEISGVTIGMSPEFQTPPLKGLCRTIKANNPDTGVMVENEKLINIRKLTPRECLRLMGWSDEQIDKIQNAKISHTQQYKLAGNGIVVQVLEAIFKELFYGRE